MSKTPKPDETLTPIKQDDTIALTAQLNSLIDKYTVLFSTYEAMCFRYPNNLARERLSNVLNDIEKAINALCERVAEIPFILVKK